MKEPLWCLQKKTEATLKKQLWSFLLYHSHIYNFLSWTGAPAYFYGTPVNCVPSILMHGGYVHRMWWVFQNTNIFSMRPSFCTHTHVYNPTFVPRTQWCIPSWRIIPAFRQVLFLKEVYFMQQRQGRLQNKKRKTKNTHTHIYIYIYLYVYTTAFRQVGTKTCRTT